MYDDSFGSTFVAWRVWLHVACFKSPLWPLEDVTLGCIGVSWVAFFFGLESLQPIHPCATDFIEYHVGV